MSDASKTSGAARAAAEAERLARALRENLWRRKGLAPPPVEEKKPR